LSGPADANFSGPFTALVLAASRGPSDPVAEAEGSSHKCLVEVAGRPMLLRVLDALGASPSIGAIAVSIEDAAVLESLPEVEPELSEGRLGVLHSAGSPSRSVLDAAAALESPFPLLITTADNPLLRPEVVEHFCAAARASGAEVVAAVAAEEVIRGAAPDTRRTFLRFRDGRFSGCNLFALSGPASLEAVRVWDQAGRHRKRPWRLVATFGPISLLLFALGRLTLDQAVARAAAVMKTSAAAVRLPFGTAAIDVDKPSDLALVRRILAARETQSSK
jgi:GTP:adenosylcobinamide-phosphate guanylyltransferase